MVPAPRFSSFRRSAVCVPISKIRAGWSARLDERQAALRINHGARSLTDIYSETAERTPLGQGLIFIPIAYAVTVDESVSVWLFPDAAKSWFVVSVEG